MPDSPDTVLDMAVPLLDLTVATVLVVPLPIMLKLVELVTAVLKVHKDRKDLTPMDKPAKVPMLTKLLDVTTMPLLFWPPLNKLQPVLTKPLVLTLTVVLTDQLKALKAAKDPKPLDNTTEALKPLDTTVANKLPELKDTNNNLNNK